MTLRHDENTRRKRNREHARNSRDRKRMLLEVLQHENRELRADNDRLRARLSTLQADGIGTAFGASSLTR